MRFAARLVLGTMGILLFSVLILVWAFRTSLRHDLEQSLERSLQREAELIRDALPHDPRAWDRIVGRLARERGHRVTVVDAQGTAVADNRLPPADLARLGSLAGQPEIGSALAGSVGVARRAEGGDPVQLLVAVPGNPVVRVASDLAAVGTTVAEAQRAVLWAALLALAVGLALAVLGGRAIARPLRELATTARAIPLDQPLRFPRSGVPEIDELVHALRRTSQELSARFDAVTQGRAASAALVEAMVEGVLATDPRGRIVTANAAARRLLGYGAEEQLPDLAQLFRAKAAREVVEATLRGEAAPERELDLDGRVVLLNARPLPSGGAVLVLHDLTKLRQLEVIRRDFVANVSHELKTPLTSIAGYSETLLAEDADRETRRRFLETILSNARRMQRLVEDQLSLARIEGGRWQPRPEALDVEAVAREAWAPMALRAEGRDIQFQVEVQPGAERLRADREALRQILGNLFDNAIRYTSGGGLVTCRAEPADGGVALAVTDTGAGIGSDHLARIFERFYRADSARSREAGGSGLGLAVVKHLVEAHGGRVRAESELGRGTTISCWFPA